MNKIIFKKTDDGTIGLYNEEIGDIYHSVTGALKESYEKFIIPSFIPELSTAGKEIKILDICYGIGYNTKAALNYLTSNCVEIDCLDTNEFLVNLSPIVYDGINKIELKLFLLSEVFRYNNYNYDFLYENYWQFILRNAAFFSPFVIDLIRFLFNRGYIINGQALNYSFLHNIYYNYISDNMNNDVKSNKYSKSKINFYIGDARVTAKLLNNKYDVVFLDAFSPQKSPQLWTIDFLNLIKQKMNLNSVLVSYSKSSPFRSALIKLGFYVGKTLIDNIDMGTVASLNQNKILTPLSDFDIALISTRCGITFKDSDLNLSDSEIIDRRNYEISHSDRLSHTGFLKSVKQIL